MNISSRIESNAWEKDFKCWRKCRRFWVKVLNDNRMGEREIVQVSKKNLMLPGPINLVISLGIKGCKGCHIPLQRNCVGPDLLCMSISIIRCFIWSETVELNKLIDTISCANYHKYFLTCPVLASIAGSE